MYMVRYIACMIPGLVCVALLSVPWAGCSSGDSGGLGASDGVVGGDNDNGSADHGADGSDGVQGGPSSACPADPNVVGLTIYANYDNGVRIGRNETLPIRAELEFVAGVFSTSSGVCWVSSDSSVFTVTSTGSTTCSIRGVSVGSATLTAALGELRSEPLPIHVQEGGLLPGLP